MDLITSAEVESFFHVLPIIVSMAVTTVTPG
jgi:hypothetical protein